MEDFVYIISFTSTNNSVVDFSICCKSDMFSIAFIQLQHIIKYYTSRDIPFSVSIDCHKPFIINNAKK